MKKNILLFIVAILFSLAILEIGIRIFLGPKLYIKDHRDDMFWVCDDELGWTKKPNSNGNFSNGFYNGRITNDSDGNRQNSVTGTFNKEYENILFIGDSTTASLEVNDDETLPAILEQKLRDQGKKVNVINLGVRGYSTGQSVLKAIQYSKKYSPKQIIYMYCDNDMGDNNIIRRAYRKFGKGVFIKQDNTDGFKPYNYPVKEYPPNYAAMVLFKENGQPYIHEAWLPEKDLDIREKQDRFKTLLKKYSYILRAYSRIRDGLKYKKSLSASAFDSRKINPIRMIRNGEKWNDSFGLSYLDGGYTRKKNKDYLNAQMRFLLNKLRQIEGLEKVYLVWFPSANEIDLVKNDSSENLALFTLLRNENVVNAFVDLNSAIIKENIDILTLQCQGDAHFCYSGNQWIAEHILDQVQF